jgi:hypothetical protein
MTGKFRRTARTLTSPIPPERIRRGRRMRLVTALSPGYLELGMKHVGEIVSNQPQSAASNRAVEIFGLTKSFDRPAVQGLDLTVRGGEFYALLGP